MTLKAWMETGLNKGGFKVCKFALKVSLIYEDYVCTFMLTMSQRIPGQPRLPVYEESDETADETAEVEEETTEETFDWPSVLQGDWRLVTSC